MKKPVKSVKAECVVSLGRIGGVWLYAIENGIDNLIVKAGKFVGVRIDDVIRRSDQMWLNLRSACEERGIRTDRPLYVNCSSLLSEDKSNVKLAKSAKLYGSAVLSIIHYAAPAKLASSPEFGLNFTTCSHCTPSCEAVCLNLSGNGYYASSQLARIARTRLRKFAPKVFWQKWDEEFYKFYTSANKSGRLLAVRANGTTDQLCPELRKRIEGTTELDVLWYDYTARPAAAAYAADKENYFVTLSLKETQENHRWIAKMWSEGYSNNVAAVVTKELREELLAESD